MYAPKFTGLRSRVNAEYRLISEFILGVIDFIRISSAASFVQLTLVHDVKAPPLLFGAELL